MAKHAFLAASASDRWLHCPPSAKLCAQEEDQGSPYAQQGTDAHELCQYLLEKGLGRDVKDPTEDLTWYDAEMREAAEGYASFVLGQVEEAKALCPDPMVCVEQTVDFSKWVEHGFGTGDCVIVADDVLHIISGMKMCSQPLLPFPENNDFICSFIPNEVDLTGIICLSVSHVANLINIAKENPDGLLCFWICLTYRTCTNVASFMQIAKTMLLAKASNDLLGSLIRLVIQKSDRLIHQNRLVL